jgi:hypothetical protein
LKISISKIKVKIDYMLLEGISVKLEEPIETIKYQIYSLNDNNEACDIMGSFENIVDVFNFIVDNNATLIEFIDEVKED